MIETEATRGQRINTYWEDAAPAAVAWLAFRGDWDLGIRYGRGATEQEAIEDLLEQEA